MNFLLVLVTATAISWIVIPLMTRLAPRLGMMDKPDPRKVHQVPVARVGGWGIVLGALIPVVLALKMEPLLWSYLFGALALLLFGAWDDSRESGHYTKFLGQFIAVIPVVTYGGLYVERLPFMGLDTLPPSVGIAFTVIAMVGMINAINHSDGLDGLAGGESMLSLIVIAFLSYLAGGFNAVVISVATIGGILGFLRYNTHPARVFMGDGGSQVLGYTLGFLVVLLTQRINPALSSAVPALLLGLPVIDIIAVLFLRAKGGMNWFKATRNHIHHRLLDLGFDHYETVIVIYSIQAFFVISAIIFRYEWDLLLVGEYLLAATIIFTALTMAERRGWRRHAAGEVSRVSNMIDAVRHAPWVLAAPGMVVAAVVPSYVVAGSLWVDNVPRDFGIVSVALFVILLVDLALNKKRVLSMRSAVYTTVVFVVYLTMYYPSHSVFTIKGVEVGFFSLLALAIGLTVRYSKEIDFRTTPTDYLIIFVILAVGAITQGLFQGQELSGLLVKGVIILYACELLINRMKKRWNSLVFSSLAALGVLSARGLL